MPNRRTIFAAIAAAAVAVAGGSIWTAQGQKMSEIKFDLGKNIVETARASGVPQFEARDVVGLVSYSVAGIPAEIPAHYTRAGYEVMWQPVFAFTMYADRARDPATLTEKVNLQLKSYLTTHEAAQAFVEKTIAQFLRGKWQRYYELEREVLLTGRSSILDETGKIASFPSTIDPTYKIPAVDWPTFARNYPHWRWVGDGVLATLDVSQLGGSDGRPLDYRMNLVFELLNVRLKRDAETQARSNKEGDAKGWNSTAKYEAGKKERAELNKRLIANAIKRGDSVVAPP